MASSTSASELPLLCALGRHRPQSLARWNDGYYFSRCQRCGSDLVRTAFGKWQVPRGFRVVWQPEPPPAPKAELVPLHDAAPEPQAQPEQQVVAEVQPEQELPPDPPVEPEAFPPPERVVESEPIVQPEPVAQLEPISRPTHHDNWFDEAPAPAVSWGRTDAVPAAAAGSVAAAGGANRLEIEAVLQHLQENPPKSVGESAPLPADAEPAAAASRPTRVYAIPDFMDDTRPLPPIPRAPKPTPSTQWVEPDTPVSARGSSAAAISAFAAAVAGAVGGMAAHGKRGLGNLRERFRRPESETDETRLETQYMGTPAVAFLTSLVIIAAVIWAARPTTTDSSPTVPNPPVAATAEQAAPISTAPPRVASSQVAAVPAATARPAPPAAGNADAAFVSASILNCRSAPAEQADSVRRLMRGERVQILSRDQNWASIAYRGGQCWVLARYISTVEPLSNESFGEVIEAPALGGIDAALTREPSQEQDVRQLTLCARNCGPHRGGDGAGRLHRSQISDAWRGMGLA